MTALIANPLMALLLVLTVFGGGYWAGYSRADAERLAEVAALKAEYASAYAEAEKKARERLEEETGRANALAVRLQEEKGRIVVQTKVITRRIKDAARSAPGCLFGPDFVRLYNEALGYGGGALPEGPASAGAGHDPGAAPAPGPGVLPGRAVTPPVSPEDLLAHARDYGAWSRSVQAQARALSAFAAGGR
ncbi:hypothetical protein NNJEOMEG_02283 [Fundidesulfovibrio magnetotacticus]|uniref:Uncharacterized protein n=1 Tax=Fundidesulfovibrio magnetotacticus TaxID=2730080 RepID=A0A6V8LVV4_9BACT|nr:hypothetical protein [Fundidesulfovibrio magnetotacticus]GFK94438.1 hypothetical protein NNJEOMEG_02283 [Fundidesulfovibrio magnetotacticus]